GSGGADLSSLGFTSANLADGNFSVQVGVVANGNYPTGSNPTVTVAVDYITVSYHYRYNTPVPASTWAWTNFNLVPSGGLPAGSVIQSVTVAAMAKATVTSGTGAGSAPLTTTVKVFTGTNQLLSASGTPTTTGFTDVGGNVNVAAQGLGDVAMTNG